MADSEQVEMTVTGLVEGLAGAYLSGWAIDLGQPAPCSIVVLDEDDREVARGVADRPRSDLAAYDLGRVDFGFRVEVPLAGQALRVFADGAELVGSPVSIGAGHYDGAVSVHDGWAEGWVHERQAGTAAPVVSLWDQDGACVGQGESAPSVGDARFAPARFRIRLDPAIFDFAELRLVARADGVGFASTLARMELTGALDEISEQRCVGWLFCPEAPTVRFELELVVEDVVIGTTIANLPRGDLRDTHPKHWRVGFDFKLKPPVRVAERPLRMSLRIQGCARDLFDGPFVVASPRGVIAAARRLARLAHAVGGPDAGEAAVLQAALADYIERQREELPAAVSVRLRAAGAGPRPAVRRFSVVIPVYRDVAVTRACIDSVLAHRDEQGDAVVLVNDDSPDPEMAELLAGYAGLPGVALLTNHRNLGFVKSINRGLDFCRDGDVILLNSDTRVFAGGLQELWAAGHAAPEIGSATALSNNATIFSYPTPDKGCVALDDIGWEEIAAAALAGNRGVVVDVPTGHGFCMMVRREMLDRVGHLDEAFGRGYGEENDLCLRGFDLGFRHVAAAGVFVEHRESVSFTDEKSSLLSSNLARLGKRYPEYAADVQDYLRHDALRVARWALDGVRLSRRADSGVRYVLVLRNWLQGGTQKAIDDIAARVGYAGAVPLDLCVDVDGMVRLGCPEPALVAVFAPGEHAALFEMLGRLSIAGVLIHQLLGHTEGFIGAFRAWSRALRRVYYLHDFYPACPRVTMIDAVGTFCGVAPVEVCARCVALGGAHDAARMEGVSPAEHRAMFHDLLAELDAVVVPSASAAGYFARAFPDIATQVVPHPEPVEDYDVDAPGAIGPAVVLFGAIGPHKGSVKLLEIAQRAQLVAPMLQFHVVGYTDIDDDLLACGNVTITGMYEPSDLKLLVAETGAQMALFLHRWPETFSYTLSEAVQMGLIPLVPDIGAPAHRVRAAGYGHVFGFPIDATEVLALMVGLVEGSVTPLLGAGPRGFAQAYDAAYAEGALLALPARV